MPRSNVEIVQRFYDAFRTRAVHDMEAMMADDIEVIQSDELPWGGVYRGRAGFQQFFATLIANITSKLALERIIDAGDHIAVIGRTQGTVVKTGAPFDVPIVHVWHIVDGKAVQFRPYIDNPTMLAALAAEQQG